MIIIPVDEQKNLYRVEEFYPADLLAEFLSTDHLLTPYTKEEMQDYWPRRRLFYDDQSIYSQLDLYVKQQLPIIASTIGVDLMACDTGFWLDEPGFCMDSHLDNEGVQASMQIYMNDNINELGTTFHNADGTVRYKPDYTINTGYIMINGPEQYHSMPTSVPRDSYRISSYSWLYPKV